MTGATLSVTEYGSPSGLPLVALHGANGTKERWARIGTEGIPQRRWICPDLRGHGVSVKSPPWTIPQLAQDVAATLDSLQIEKTDLIGASLGGNVAFALARLKPARVRSLVLLDPAVSSRAEYLRRTPFEPVYEVETLGDYLESRMSQRPPDAREWIRTELIAAREETASGTFRIRADPAANAALRESTSEQLPPSLGKFTGDVLLLASGLSDAVTEAGRTALRSQLGERLNVVTIEDAGHVLLWDAFEETVFEIEKFLHGRGVEGQEAAERCDNHR